MKSFQYNFKTVIFFIAILFTLPAYSGETVYEDAESSLIKNWTAYVNESGTATVQNIYDATHGSRVIKFTGDGLKDGFKIGARRGALRWNNTNEKHLHWSMNYSEDVSIYISLKTVKGPRSLKYSNVDASHGLDRGHIHHGLGANITDGTWRTFNRDLEADLKKFDSSNSIIAVYAFMIRGSGSIDDIKLYSDESSENHIPVADAGLDNTINVGSEVQLNGSESADADGDALTYAWSFISKPEGSTATLSDFSLVNPLFIVDVNGTYRLQLIVNDGQADSVADNVVFTVTPEHHVMPPIAVAKVDDTNITEGVLVTFDANSSYDRDGTILSYEWKENGVVLSTNKKFSLNNLTIGRHNILLTVMDDDGLKGTDTVVVYVKKLTNQGVSFHTAFMTNHAGGATLSFFISAKEDTDGNITLYDRDEVINFSVSAGDIEEVIIPNRVMLSGTTKEKKVIEIMSQKDIVVIGVSRKKYTTDAYLVLPDKILSTEYYALTYGNNNTYIYGKEEFAIVATEDNTNIDITLPNDLGNFTISLAKGETYQYQKGGAGNWLTGAYITSNKKIALLGGNSCVNIPQDKAVTYCDHIVEQILPINTWETDFITTALATRKKGDTFRVLASKDATEVKVNGTVVSTLNAGEYYETILENSNHITANNPILIAQYSNSTTYDGVTSDPFMALVPALNQFDTEHIINTPNGFTDYVNIIVPTIGINDIELDGLDIDASEFKVVTGTSYSSAQIQISGGKHTLISDKKIGILGYGFAAADSYGYPSSLRLVTH